MKISTFPFKQEETEYPNTPNYFSFFHQVYYNVEFIADRFKRGVPKPRKEKNGTFVSNPHNLTERAKVFSYIVWDFQKETADNISDKRQHSHPELFKEQVKELIEYCNTCISIIEQDKEYYFNLITEPYHPSITDAKCLNWYEIVYDRLGSVKRSAELYLPKKGKTKELPTFEELFHDKINAQKVISILDENEYTKNGKWVYTGNEKGIATAYYVLRDEYPEIQIAKTTIKLSTALRVWCKQFGIIAYSSKDNYKGDVTLQNLTNRPKYEIELKPDYIQFMNLFKLHFNQSK